MLLTNIMFLQRFFPRYQCTEVSARRCAYHRSKSRKGFQSGGYGSNNITGHKFKRNLIKSADLRPSPWWHQIIAMTVHIETKVAWYKSWMQCAVVFSPWIARIWMHMHLFWIKSHKKAFKDGCKRTNKFKSRRKFERNRRMKTKTLNFLMPKNVKPIPVKPQDCCKIISASLILLFPDEINWAKSCCGPCEHS